MATPGIKLQAHTKFTQSFNQLLNGEGRNGLDTWSQAWIIAREYLKPRDIKDRHARPTFISDVQVRNAFGIMVETKRLGALFDAFLEDMRRAFHLVEYEIREYMRRFEETQNPELIRMLIARMTDWHKAWAPPTDLGSIVTSGYNLAFQTRLFAALPLSFTPGFKMLCSWSLSPEDFAPPVDPSSAPSTTSTDIEIDTDTDTFDGQPLSPAQRHIVWKQSEELGLVERYASIIANVGYERIERLVAERCVENWSRPMLGELRFWVQENVMPWLIAVHGKGSSRVNIAGFMASGAGQRLDYHVNKVLCNLRTREIFDIIIDYPDSAGALRDLKECLHRVDQRGSLVNTLRKANAKRLLHPGADTKLILMQYVATIKCLRIIDPPGVLLYKVADPIRRYLRERPDTIRCIVASLVGDEDSGDSLIDDNEPIQPLQQSEVEDYNDPNWMPEPLDAGPEFKANRPSDVLSTLVSIYDSNDLFVKELQVLLAQRLLAITDGDIRRVERERRNIEILKIRFGEAALQVCEVMLKDMTDSRRTDAHVQSQVTSVVHPTIISHNFWPSLDTSEFTMPGQFQRLQESYSQQFTVFKPDKKLKWLPHLGTVHLELELEDRKVEVDVAPLEAAFIELFGQKNVWTLEELIAAVGNVDKSAAVKALSTWAGLGVVKEQTENSFILLERAEDGDGEAAMMMNRMDVQEAGPAAGPSIPPAQTLQEQQAEQMRIHWKYIEGMLTNLGSLSVDRIQSMLKFVPNYDQTVEQLGMFMEAARREGLVVNQAGMWKLNK